MAETKRRARGEDSIYYDRSRDRWTGTITVGWKPDGRRDRIDVDFALGTLADRLSTRSVRLARMILIQAIRNAMVNDLVVRNAAGLTAVPTGKGKTNGGQS